MSSWIFSASSTPRGGRIPPQCSPYILAKGLRFGFAGSKGLLKERDALGWMRGFRLAVVGGCLFGIAVAWVWHVLWLFVISVGILGEELLETSVIFEALKRAPAPRSYRVRRTAARGSAELGNERHATSGLGEPEWP